MPEGRGPRAARFVPLPTAVVDDWVPHLTGSQLKLLLVVARQTLGFADPATGGRRAEDWLTHRQLMARTGCASEAVSGAVDALVRAGLVRVRASGGEEANTPQHRRRACSRLLYGLGPALTPNLASGGNREREAPASASPVTSESGHRKPKTTKESVYKKDILVVFENRSGSQDGNHGRDERQVQADDPPGTPPVGVDEHRSRSADAAGRRWVWRKFDARWVRAGEASDRPD